MNQNYQEKVLYTGILTLILTSQSLPCREKRTGMCGTFSHHTVDFFFFLLHALKSYLTILIIILTRGYLQVMQSNFCLISCFARNYTSFFKVDLIKWRIHFELTSINLTLKATHPKRDATSCPGIFLPPIPSPGRTTIQQNHPSSPRWRPPRTGTHR